ncbi:PIN domain-containing protein [Candidatus Woesearchaeota archaeon]|nr:PIN domain-containing protein [Candidatus Woesearchaeota archaeon]
MTCLETTFLIDLLRGKENVNNLKEELERTESSLSITPISIMELWIGATIKSSDKEKERILALIDAVEVLNFDVESAKEAGEIDVSLTKQGMPIEITDVMIAGIAKTHHEKLVTRDAHFARIPGLRVLKY